MKGKKVIAGILLAGILAVTLAGCKNTDNTKEETERPVITLGSDNYPPYNYLNEDGVPTGIDVELAQKLSKEWDIRWTLSGSTGRRKKNWWRAERLTVSWVVFLWKDVLTIIAGQDRT